MKSSERLTAYYPFSGDILENVDEAACLQDRFSFQELADYYGLPDGPSVISEYSTKPFDILRFTPSQDYDSSHVRIYHAPMGNNANKIMAMRMMRLFGADPTIPLILTGNPTRLGVATNKLGAHDAFKVWRGDLAPTVQPLLRYLADSGVQTVDNIGFSYGADKAAVSASSGPQLGIATTQAVLMESAVTVNRGLVGLLRDFAPTGGKRLQAAIQASDSLPLREVWGQGDSGMVRYSLGLARLSNLVIARSLAHDYFEQRTEAALTHNPFLRATLAWGTASELAPAAGMATITHDLSDRHNGRVRGLPLEGMYHAGGDDINLHAAIVLQALRGV